MTRNFHFLNCAELHIGTCSSISYKHSLVVNHFLKCNKIKRILISFNFFSEYMFFIHVNEISFVDTCKNQENAVYKKNVYKICFPTRVKPLCIKMF